MAMIEKNIFLYIGTYTEGESEGIYIYRFNPATLQVNPVGVVKDLINPTFLAIHPNKEYLYAGQSIVEQGIINAYSINHSTGRLSPINEKSSEGSKPCHLVVDKNGRHVLAANFGDGSVCVLPINEDGSLCDASDVKKHKGSSIHPQRQTGPHAHSINLDRANKYAIAADLGIDKLVVYRYDCNNGSLSLFDNSYVEVKKGSGPRHFTFHPNGRFAYLITEMGHSIVCYEYSNGVLKQFQTVDTLPNDYLGKNGCAEIRTDAKGEYLYGSNRGHDSIVVYSINKKTGVLEYIEHIDALGNAPRNFNFTSDFEFMFVTNNSSCDVKLYKRNKNNGSYTFANVSIEVPNPVCVKLLEI